MCASSSTTRIFEVTAIPSIDHPAVSALSGLRDRNVNSPRLTSPPCGEVGSGATRPCRVGGPSPPHLVGRSARARSAPPGRGTLTSPPCGEVGSSAKRPARWGPSPPHLVGRSARARSAPAGWGGRLIFIGPEYKLQRVPCQPEPVAHLLLQVSPVGEVQEPCVVDEENDRRRLRLRLRRVAETKPPTVVARRGMLDEGLPEDLVQLVGGHLDSPLPDDLQRHRHDPADAFLRLRGHRYNRRVGRELERRRERLLPV